MEKTKYFLDSYALIEIMKDNKNFKRFLDFPTFTGIMNLLELHYILNREISSEKADSIIEKLKSLVIQTEIRDIKTASRFKTKHSSKKFSYIDCLGYAMAINRNMKFLTGDNEFKGIKGVEFIK